MIQCILWSDIEISWSENEYVALVNMHIMIQIDTYTGLIKE